VDLEGPDGGWKPGERVTFTLRLTNGGAGHKIPTGDPDRYFLTTFTERDATGKVVRTTSHKITRWIIWKPIIIEVFGNRIPPLKQKDYTYRVTARKGHTLEVQVSYHILTQRQKDRLIERYGLPPDTMDSFPLYDRTVDLDTGTLTRQAAADPGRCMPPGHPA
jgi:hypothetical protein